MIWTLSLPSRRFILGRNRHKRNFANPRYPVALYVDYEARAVVQRYYKRPSIATVDAKVEAENTPPPCPDFLP
jgi:hypothetical protein